MPTTDKNDRPIPRESSYSKINDNGGEDKGLGIGSTKVVKCFPNKAGPPVFNPPIVIIKRWEPWAITEVPELSSINFYLELDTYHSNRYQ